MQTPPASVDAFDGEPQIAHISDVHGYLSDARSALRAVGDADTFNPVVVTDDDGTLHWADNNYVLVVNGDLIDRGPANDACLDLVWRLQQEAPPGRVRYHLGNHELAILLPELVRWPDAYSTNLDAADRRLFIDRVQDGDVTVAFEGYAYTYSHAGCNDAFHAADVNETLRDSVGELSGNGSDEHTQRRLANRYPHIFGIGETHGGRGPDAGLCWMDFAHLEPTSPPQIVGHTKRFRPVRKGNVVCGNVIRMNQASRGGEGVLIEEPDTLTALRRKPNGSVSITSI